MPIFLLTNFAVTKKVHTFASLLRATPSLHKQHDSLAQLVEHNTFNVGVLGFLIFKDCPQIVHQMKRCADVDKNFGSADFGVSGFFRWVTEDVEV